MHVMLCNVLFVFLSMVTDFFFNTGFQRICIYVRTYWLMGGV